LVRTFADTRASEYVKKRNFANLKAIILIPTLDLGNFTRCPSFNWQTKGESFLIAHYV